MASAQRPGNAESTTARGRGGPGAPQQGPRMGAGAGGGGAAEGRHLRTQGSWRGPEETPQGCADGRRGNSTSPPTRRVKGGEAPRASSRPVNTCGREAGVSRLLASGLRCAPAQRPRPPVHLRPHHRDAPARRLLHCFWTPQCESSRSTWIFHQQRAPPSAARPPS